ncbi:HD-GYP domain-containing protein [Azospirillum sp. SYSU D00513]|uniref:HD-GYP domain-containing protein n=1 Tax=Azospirillum sp. SYSU D00513 TaxID=2812561 RepID=UPI001A9721DF|nr:HD-GYP domain-containing protein [Azospirillum sp. SYSU D00513]
MPEDGLSGIGGIPVIGTHRPRFEAPAATITQPGLPLAGLPPAGLICLSKAVQARDSLTEGHALSLHEEGVARLSSMLADRMGFGSAQVEAIGRAAGVHDIGKIALPDSILLKPGPLDAAQWAVLRNHTVLGGAILSGHEEPVLRLAATIARWHHEAFDGSGYPDGLAGEAIPLEARLVAVADVYDALRQGRPYKRGLSHDEAMHILRNGDGRTSPGQFDPQFLNAFLGIEREVERLWGDDGEG